MSSRYDSVPIYPAKTLVAVFDTAVQAREAERDLQAAGFTLDGIKVVHGREGLEDVRATIAQEPLLTHTLRAVHSVLDPGRAEGPARNMQDYFETLENGKSNLLVFVPTDEQRERATATLRDNGGHSMTYLGDWTKECLE